ncbi:hypothetical protein [Paenibacillus harenae]|uniref:dUTPase n=1 Tax=Paenibacillus harenae TaxID=306543 RepID=A0ABT9U0A3_PAEHA|nr:hypothetical protein [Paenibacillus harenae]MDQ0112541.1 hypothetical protein [Paenibacillus harenae]
MKENKRKAYLALNYQALLDIKNSGESNIDNFNRVFRVAHAFHTLALFIMEDFVGFNEDDFWENIAGLERDFGLTHYSELFEKVSSDELLR